MRILLASFLLAFASLVTAQQSAPVTATAPWARPTVQGQRTSGAFVTLTASEPLTLVGVSSPIAGVAEIHEMKLEGDVMRMRSIDALPLAPGKPFELKPGGHHVMLQELKAPLAPNTSIPLTLSFRTAKGESRQLVVQVPVTATPPKELGAVSAHPQHGR
jgi:periplasmic copper chaperone A